MPTSSAAIETILPSVGPERGLSAPLPPDLKDKLIQAMPGLKERAKTLIELLDSAYYLYAQRPLALDDKARALLSDEGRARLAGVRPALEALADWSAAATEGAVRAVRRGGRLQARAGGPAPAGGAHRPHHLPAPVRRDGGARPGRDPGAAR